MMKQQAWIMMAFALVAAQQWVSAQPGGGKPGGLPGGIPGGLPGVTPPNINPVTGIPGAGPPGGGNAGGGNAGGGKKTARKVKPNNGYTKGVANYALNTITIGGRTITPRIKIQDFSKRGARILLRSKRWGGVAYPYLAIGGGNSGGGGNAGGGTSAPPTGGGGSW